MSVTRASYVSTTNACKVCAPLGACIALRGVEGSISLLHGSQGCSTYIRRYLISHYGEPVDIASSSFGEVATIFGGEANLRRGLKNVAAKYHPRLIGVATTCLAETIGDDVERFLHAYRQESGEGEPILVPISTPSYAGTHIDGFHAATKALVDRLAEAGEREGRVNLLPGFVSPADLRYLKEILEDFGLASVLLPDYSETLDGPILKDYAPIPAGGTSPDAIRSMGAAHATLEFGRTLPPSGTAGTLLEERFDVPLFRLGSPIGVKETKPLFDLLSRIAGRPIPRKHELEVGRLIDAYADGHKYVFGKRVVVFGEEDLVVGLTSFLSEIGMTPVLCASGGESGRMAEAIGKVSPESGIAVREGADFREIEEEAETLRPDLMIGSGKGYSVARRLGVPLIRVGFPIHDRFGGQRLLHLGYRGAQRLFDQIVNALIEKKQDSSPIGYSYM